MRIDPRKRYSSTATFKFAEGEPVLFRGLLPRRVAPRDAYLEHELQHGERLDSLAENYYGDARLWWVIAQANGAIFFPADIVYEQNPTADGIPEFRAGQTIIIPAKPEDPE
jgi:hypothetical protein